MILYNYWIKFGDANTGEFVRTDRERNSWEANRKHAEANMCKDIDWCNGNTDAFVKVIDYGIEEKEFPEPVVVLTGILHDIGDYARLEMAVDGIAIRKEIFEKFKGNKVRLTVEILDF